MRNTYRLIMLAAVAALAMSATAKTDGVIITGPTGESAFAITDVREIVFDNGVVTVIQTDNSTMTFAQDWIMTFGEVDPSGIIAIDASKIDSPIDIFDTTGRMVAKSVRIGDIDLPSGIYIIKYNGNSIKIKR